MKSSSLVDAIIFDMDNVLIDTRKSYLDAIRWTVEIYLVHGSVPLFQHEQKNSIPHFLSLKDVDQFKLLGGFNDDWDCCYGLLTYLLSLPIKKRTLKHLQETMNIPAFTKKVHNRPLGVAGIVKMLGRSNSVMIEKISRIFQEVYLGKGLFEQVEKKRRVYWKKRGLIHKEKSIFKRPLLEKLKQQGFKLGIATGRSRFEALYALKHFHLLDLFDGLTTMDEVKKAEQEARQSLRKPHPFSILETARQLGNKNRFFYIGDLPDDIYATHQASSFISIQSVAFPWFAANPQGALQEIQRIKPNFILKKAKDIVPLALGAKSAVTKFAFKGAKSKASV
jgi:phosphoglycolate phosphatase-like HAD superfamily hydrolase